MKRKILSVLLCAAMVATMAVGCGGEEKKEDAGSGSDSKTEEGSDEGGKTGDVNGDGKIIVGYISKNIVDPFHAPINDFATE